MSERLRAESIPIDTDEDEQVARQSAKRLLIDESPAQELWCCVTCHETLALVGLSTYKGLTLTCPQCGVKQGAPNA